MKLFPAPDPGIEGAIETRFRMLRCSVRASIPTAVAISGLRQFRSHAAHRRLKRRPGEPGRQTGLPHAVTSFVFRIDRHPVPI